jgi:hypothetical protein
MSKLRGWNNSVRSEAVRIASELNSSRPYAQFSVIGERRSGRSTFFRSLAQQLNNTAEYSSRLVALESELEINQAGDLVTAFHEALVRSLATSSVEGAVNCTLTEQELVESDALFLLAAKVVENLNLTPVFLVDMGAALESADNASVLKLGRVLKWIANSKGDKDIPLALGLGWTGKFFERAAVIAGDVFRDRYRATRTLGNSFESESEAPFDTFRSIVKDIAAAEIPSRFAGLLRVPRLTAGMYGENLSGLRANVEVSPAMLWEALRARWPIIPQLSYNDTNNLTSADLAELLLADGRLAANSCPEYLELTEPNSFAANDKLYERFGLLPPRRDPTIRERFTNRLNDQEDCALADEIAESIRRALSDVCHAEISEIKSFPGRSCIVSATLNELPPPLEDDGQATTPELDQKLDTKALPKRFTIGVYLDSPDAQEFEQELTTALKRGDFLMVCYPQGILQAIGETEPFRAARKERLPYCPLPSAEEDLCTLTSRGADTSRSDTIILSWINRCVGEHLRMRPVIPLLSENGKKALGAIIASAGRLRVEQLKQNLGLTNAECNEVISHLQKAGIITKSKGVLYWDPAQDPVLGSLLASANDPKQLAVQLAQKFTLSDAHLDAREILAAYSGVFQTREHDAIRPEDVPEWYAAHRPQLLQEVEDLIASDRDLAVLKPGAESLQGRTLEDLGDIAGDRQEIDMLLTDATKKLQEIRQLRETAATELQQAKNNLKKCIEEKSSYFTTSEREEMLSQIDGLKAAGSSGVIHLKKKLQRRITERDVTTKALKATKERMQGLESEAEGKLALTLDQLVGQVDELSNQTNLSDLNRKLVEVNKAADEAERQILRRKVVAIRKKPVEPPLSQTPESRAFPPIPLAPVTTQPPVSTIPPPPISREKTPPAVTAPEPPATKSPEVTTAEERKDQTFDISKPEEVKKLAELLQSPKAEIKRIVATFE